MTGEFDSTESAAVAIYLNDHEDSFAGFHPDSAQLRLAARFTITVPSTSAGVRAALEGIFEQLNIGGDLIEAAAYTEHYRVSGHRSLSVGDVVVIGETAFAVARIGFDTIPATALNAAIARAAA